MSEHDRLRSHVERCMQQVWDDADLTTDDDGDYRFRSDTGFGWIRVHTSEWPGVSATVFAVTGLPGTAAVLREINEVNTRIHGARAMLEGDGLLVRGYLPADGITPNAFRMMIMAVCELADDIGPMLASVHGGACTIPTEMSAVD